MRVERITALDHRPAERPAGSLKRLGSEEPPPYDGQRLSVSVDGTALSRFVAAELDRVLVMDQAADDELENWKQGIERRLDAVERWPEWMTAQTARRYLDGISAGTLRRWVNEQCAAGLPEIARRRGTTTYYRRADLDALMERRFPDGSEPTGTDSDNPTPPIPSPA